MIEVRFHIEKDLKIQVKEGKTKADDTEVVD